MSLSSTQTLPREVTWHPQLQQLVYSPVEEQAKLRGAVIGSLKSQALAANVRTSLKLPKQLGNQSEIKVSFARPTSAVRLSVNVMVDAASSAQGTEFFIEYVPAAANDGAAATVQVGSGGITGTLQLPRGVHQLVEFLWIFSSHLHSKVSGVAQRSNLAIQRQPGECRTRVFLLLLRQHECCRRRGFQIFGLGLLQIGIFRKDR